jgi:hypothetical protein
MSGMSTRGGPVPEEMKIYRPGDIHLSGDAITNETLADPEFGISIPAISRYPARCGEFGEAELLMRNCL